MKEQCERQEKPVSIGIKTETSTSANEHSRLATSINFFPRDSKQECASSNQGIPAATAHFNALKAQAPSPQLTELLSVFTEPKTINLETFTTGVKTFIRLANASVQDKSRETLYGSNYLGLHYSTELVRLWNAATNDGSTITTSDVDSLAPASWNSTDKDEYKILIYEGQQPAQALDELVKGPATIDCGMFIQLSFWFGIRYMLGNERFNCVFGKAPFFITQFNYHAIKSPDRPHCGNPLFPFLSPKEIAPDGSILVKYLRNTPLYISKHPGENDNGKNCIVIRGKYTIFNPGLARTQDLEASAVPNMLREAFNQEQTQNDRDCLVFYASHPYAVSDWHGGILYEEVIKVAESLKDKQLTEEEFAKIEQYSGSELAFDLNKFSAWLACVENPEHDDSSRYSPQF